MESRIDGRVCFASILTLSLIRLDRGTASWRMPTVAANDTPLLTTHLKEEVVRNFGFLGSKRECGGERLVCIGNTNSHKQ